MTAPKPPRQPAGSAATGRFTVRQIRLVPASEQQRRAAVKALSALIVSSADPHAHRPDAAPDHAHNTNAETGPARQQAA
jgi:hypothetical protein